MPTPRFEQVAVDVGNTRIKWSGTAGMSWSGPVEAGQVVWDAVVGDRSVHWAVAGSNPPRRDEFVKWARDRGDQVLVIDHYSQLGLSVLVDFPERVGMDRLLNAVGAYSLSPTDAIVIDAGTALTVDVVGSDGSFQGGVIMPGLRLMAKALHDYTALLPEVTVSTAEPTLPGKNTEDAIRAGVWYAAAGGVAEIIRRCPTPPSAVYLTGGDAELIRPVLKEHKLIVDPLLTLRGIQSVARKCGFFR